ncbi:hypothetical protein [Anaerococcus lactolyticus]|uniref:3-keto-disaccharide hydrolase domain-containing protein n=1 Tax=Anaerococcus lactolyticus S7-1-13 TaxID=1284686 RepID=A0A095Z9G9_9FIRM|nr:hypothetical protein [Anaerococcus lactolyticus]KGF05119.1 hypothetical protein HMPREF1630_01560 [Anaerococcus lactolyticus S7-1-13]
MESLKFNNFDIKAVNTGVSIVKIDNEEVLRVVKSEKINKFDENTIAKITNINMRNGEIRLKMLSKLLENAPDFARGFIGIAFRVNEQSSKFESFYLRPTNGRHPDKLRRSHGCQYFSYPGYTFEYFREFNIPNTEAEADIGLNEWIDLKAVIYGEKASFFVNDFSKPVLEIKNLIHGAKASGNLGLFVDIGTEGFFKDIEIKKYN